MVVLSYALVVLLSLVLLVCCYQTVGLLVLIVLHLDLVLFFWYCSAAIATSSAIFGFDNDVFGFSRAAFWFGSAVFGFGCNFVR